MLGIETEECTSIPCVRVKSSRAALECRLVEVHEYLRPGVTDALLGWYAASHDIRRTPTVAAGGLALPGVPGLSRGQVRLLADEMRPAPMEWFWMTPRH